MKRKRRREFQKEEATRFAEFPKLSEKSSEAPNWLGDQSGYLTVIGIALIALCTVIIYGQTVQVPPIDYEDPFYLVHSPYVHVSPSFSRLSAVWIEPYFANFHPVTTTTWLIDRALADKSKPFDGLPFRVTQLLYAALGASLLIPLYRRLGLPAILAAIGALLFAVHPIHTEVVAWLSARKDLVSLIFIVLSFLAWLWARAASTSSQWRLRHAVAIILVILAVLSKPIAVILPALFAAYEFCSAPHASIAAWCWTERKRQPLLTRVLALITIFAGVGGVSTMIFRTLLARDAMHGGWLIFVPIGLLFLLALAPSAKQLAAFQDGSTTGIRVLGPPFAILSVVFGAGSAWTFWAQQQVGAIKGGLTLLPTLNLTFNAMLAYAGKTFIPAYMSASYSWNEYPYLSVRGLLGAAFICTAVWIGVRLAGSPDRNCRIIAFGIFWYLIALIPVSNLIPTSTKMADRYLFVPTAGAILSLLALIAALIPEVRRMQFAMCGALMLVVVFFTAWSYDRTEVWCGKTTEWNDRPQPDLSLWTAAVETNPENIFALNSLGLSYLRLSPPEADKALVYLNRALQIGEASESKIAGDSLLILTPVYEGLGDGYLTQASQLNADKFSSSVWQQKKKVYANAVKYFALASKAPSGFASSDARVLSRFAEACEGQAQMDAQEIAISATEQRASLIRERDELRSKSEESMRHAREILAAGNVAPIDPNYRTVVIGQGNIIFGREVGASNEEKVAYYRQALVRYQEAATLLPDDPRPLLYEGLCYERLTGIAQSPEEKHGQFVLGVTALRKALTLNIDATDYNSALPYRALASIYSHVDDFQSVLDSLKKAQQVDPSGPSSATSLQLARDIQNVEQFLTKQAKNH
jgi:tetratricopeptide (TPR) repeat protein